MFYSGCLSACATIQMAQHTLTEVMILLCTVCLPAEGHMLPRSKAGIQL